MFKIMRLGVCPKMSKHWGASQWMSGLRPIGFNQNGFPQVLVGFHKTGSTVNTSTRNPIIL